VRSETINAENLPDIEWGEEYFKFCNFEDFSIQGGEVASDFVDCSFKNIDCYLTLLNGCNFISCNFEDCRFAGTGFPDTRFVDCRLVGCKFTQDNLGRDCDFSKTVVYGCSIESSLGFAPHL
jgi:uncharacterized protein YjbI with pentapeptide repeats